MTKEIIITVPKGGDGGQLAKNYKQAGIKVRLVEIEPEYKGQEIHAVLYDEFKEQHEEE